MPGAGKVVALNDNNTILLSKCAKNCNVVVHQQIQLSNSIHLFAKPLFECFHSIVVALSASVARNISLRVDPNRTHIPRYPSTRAVLGSTALRARPFCPCCHGSIVSCFCWHLSVECAYNSRLALAFTSATCTMSQLSHPPFSLM